MSPWVRHRLVRDDEFVRSVLDRHGSRAAEEFVEEVVWRTYWKGGLALRPCGTAGRFTNVRRLAIEASALSDDWAVAPGARPPPGRLLTNKSFGLPVTEDDFDPRSLGLPLDQVRAAAGIAMPHGLSPMPAGICPGAFSAGFVADALQRTHDASGCPTEMLSSDLGAEDVIDWARSAGVDAILTGYVPIGPTRDWLDRLRAPLDRAGISLTTPRRIWDNVPWPRATKGFFPFKEKLPSALRHMGTG